MSVQQLKTEDYLQTENCNHNDSLEKACMKPRGGESCAFDGAYIVLNPIRDAAHLVHGSIVCAAHSFESRGSLSSGSRMYRTAFTTDLTEMDIIYGGEEKLYHSAIYIAERHKPSAIFIYSTCVPGVTGEDIDSVAEKVSAITGIPAIPVHSPGFLGHKNLGNRIAGDTLLKHVIGTGSHPEDVSNVPTVNFIGEYNIAGETWGLLPLFQKAGIKVLSKMTGDSDYKEITWAHQAKANLLVCGRALINVAVGMEEKYGIPYSEVSFFGMENTSRALRETARMLNNPEISCRVEQVIEIEESKTRRTIEKYKKSLQGKKAVVYTGGVKSWSMIMALHDLGIEVTACGTKKSSLGDIEKMKSLIGEERILHDTSPKNIMKVYRETKANILVAGGRNQYLAAKEKIPFIDVNQEKHTPYSGYAGLANLAEDIYKTIHTPVWTATERKAPWENQ